MISNRYDRALEALDHVPEGARLVSFVRYSCSYEWNTNRMEHLSAMAIVRRRAFSNDQWEMAGAQLMTINGTNARNREVAYNFRTDPSQMVIATPCLRRFKTLNLSLANLPRDEFDYVWLIDPPRFDPRGLRGMTRIWHNGHDALYRIDDRTMVPAS